MLKKIAIVLGYVLLVAAIITVMVFAHIGAQQHRNTQQVTYFSISIDGAEVGAVSYIPMSYCYSVLTGKADENLQNVVKALYLYNQAANAYFGTNSR